MSLYPAATALNVFESGSQSRLATRASYSSPLYIAHKDLTKILEHPNTIQEVLNGTATGGTTDTETQYCVRLAVPGWSRTVCLYWYAQVLLSASTGYVTDLTMTTASGSALRFNIYGRFPSNPSATSYTAVTAGLSNAIDLDSLGAWRIIGQVISATGTASGLTCTTAAIGNAPGLSATVHEVSSTRRVMIGHFGADARLALSASATPFSAWYTGSTSQVQPADSSFGFPLMGATEILVLPCASTGTPAPSFSATGTSVSSVDFVALAASFHS